MSVPISLDRIPSSHYMDAIFNHGLPELVPPPLRQAALPHDRPNRRVKERVASEYLCSRDVARILPFSTRQICAMAAAETLPAFKFPGCTVWCSATI